ncbi:MAG: TDT family transporter [Pseudomonadota bacterium]|nr:TDT family transporter [Pseudomonadota bacterium]
MRKFFPLHALAHPSELIRQFTPNWFTLNMGTGILFILLAQFPFNFPWRMGIVHMLFWADTLFFMLFFGLFTTRWLFFRHYALPLLRHPVQSMFFGALPMALIPLVNGLVMLFPQWSWGSQAALYLWWFDVFLSLGVGWLVPIYQFVLQEHSLENLTGVWLLPIVPAEVAASSAGLLAMHLPVSQARILVVTGYALWGMSVPLALGILTLLYFRLAVHKLPSKDMGVSTWLALGPLGTGALALQTLGVAAPHALSGSPLSALGLLAEPMGVAGALILWGLGLWWLMTAMVLTLVQIRRGLPFNLGWWGFTFPLGVYIASTFALGIHSGIIAFTFFSVLLTVALAGIWSVVAARSLYGLWSGHLVHAPCLASMTEVPAATIGKG